MREGADFAKNTNMATKTEVEALKAKLELEGLQRKARITAANDLAYQWDENGNLSQRQDLLQGLTEAFAYDNLDRLSSSTLSGVQSLGLTIDPTGNIVSRTEGPYGADLSAQNNEPAGVEANCASK